MHQGQALWGRPRALALALAAGGLLGLPAGCGNEAGPAPPVTGRLGGRVVLNLTAEPLAGVTVTCSGGQRVTGADGLFEFAELPRGTLAVLAEKPDYRPLARTVELGESGFLALALVPVDSTADISGTVGHRVDGPVAGAEVRCAGLVAITGGDGAWTLADVPLGYRQVTVTHPAYLPLTAGLLAAHARETLAMTVTRAVDATLPLAKDTEIRWDELHLYANYGRAPTAAASDRTRSQALLGLPAREDLSPLMTIVDSAFLRLHVRRQFLDELPSDVATCLGVRIVREPWDELTVTGGDTLGSNRIPPLFSRTSPDCWPPLDGQWQLVEVDVTRYMAEVLAGLPHFGLLFQQVLPAGVEGGGAEIATKENLDRDLRPTVAIRGEI